ncbi:DNA polymerase III subunit epsilon [Moraxella sp. FZLJ2107]|uniref:DNA polymerase III subunit epsilon n=1 Tax=unclassified Moraxella TaxID=2685852 RepID=UPI0020C84E2A|nr:MULTISPECIES: DNA polymerase III subunit epsilon [unclassified Moraxella]UTO05630.1 DNA polymerase III subunit epsilon [Moraxella sp. FZLJ2107]UTO22366.1 DNA polymerase III subunit epsilon [Moraxella sp. FZLJ2109]
MTYPIIAYTDGACKGNGQAQAAAGGYGVHLQFANGDVHNLWGGEPDTTNNRMELMAAIVALESTPADTPIQIWTDSGYVKDGITKWIVNWKARGWKKADGKPVLNLELWQRLDNLTQNRHIDWQWIKGHAGHAGNEMADKLANLGVNGSGDELISSTNSAQQTQCNHEENLYNNDQNHMTTSTQSAPKLSDHNTVQNPAYDGDTSRANPDFWPILPKPVNRGMPNRQLIMDTETTGFYDQGGDRIVEVGIIELVDRKFTGNQLHVYINPEKQMDEDVIRVHGISNEFVADKPKFAEVAQMVYDFMIGSEVIAHNAAFDMRFLDMEFTKAGLPDFLQSITITDSLALAKQLYPGQKNSLDALRIRLGVGNQDRTFHGALLDSEILAEVYLAMTAGQMSFAMEDERKDTESIGEDVQFNNLANLANLLVRSHSDTTADQAWRDKVLS